MIEALRYRVEVALQRVVDLWFMSAPRRRPSAEALADCKLVSHRGEHDNRRVYENSMAAFAAVADAGIWGVEFDLRWTRDLQPVVIHDADTRRVFGVDLRVADTDLAELRRRVPQLPTLAEVVQAFAGKLHLMVELKTYPAHHRDLQAARLARIFSGLEPGKDFHFLALREDLLEAAAFAGARACLLVAEYNLAGLSEKALQAGLGGLCGHYLLLNSRLLRRHHRQGQKLGTGFPASRFALYRELNRGVDWIFTDHALKLGALRRRLLDSG